MNGPYVYGGPAAVYGDPKWRWEMCEGLLTHPQVLYLTTADRFALVGRASSQVMKTRATSYTRILASLFSHTRTSFNFGNRRMQEFCQQRPTRGQKRIVMESSACSLRPVNARTPT